MERSLIAGRERGRCAGTSAKGSLAEVLPAAHFVINDANVFAVRLLMMDAAGLSADQDKARWLAVGAGVSVTVVTARFEAGYMRTVSALRSGEKAVRFSRGSFLINIFR